MSIRRVTSTVLATAVLAATAAAQERVDFARQVLPVLEKRCLQCHKASYVDAAGARQNPEGGLRLDGKAWIEKGGDSGPAVVTGKPEQSPIYTRTSLPADDVDRMPAEGAPLAKDEIETVRRWIQEGAAFGAWTGTADVPVAKAPVVGAESQPAAAPLPVLQVVPASLAEGLAPLAPQVLAKAAGSKARITPISAGSPLLSVEFCGAEDQSGDADVAALLPLAQHVTRLVLARTRVTDQALATVAKMPRLTTLDLRETGIDDAGVATLAPLQQLRVLNLHATKVSDRAVADLGKLTALTAVHLWHSEVTDAGLARLREALPAAKVTGAPTLPAPDAGGGGGQRRRRGK